MITVEELKKQFPVKDVAPYGSCIVVPGAEFDPDWEVFLSDQGYKCHMTDIYGKPVTLVKLKSAGKNESEKEVYQPKKEKEVIEKTDVHEKKELAELSPWQDPERRWKLEEDELIIALWNQKLNVLEICTELRKRFPNRTKDAVKCRVTRLIKAGKISGRWHKGTPKVPKKEPKKKAEKIERAKPEPAPGPSPPAPPVPVINTTLTIQLSVNCNDRKAVENLFYIIKKMGLKKKEARPSAS